MLALAAVVCALALPLGAEPAAGEIVTVLGWGPGPGCVGYPAGMGDGVPPSFLADPARKVHVLDSMNFRILPHVRPDGSHDAPLPFPDRLRGSKSFVVDFDRLPDGGFVLLDRTAGMVEVMGPAGESIGRFGQVERGLEIAYNPPDKVAVYDEGVAGLHLFALDGKFLESRMRPETWPFPDAEGRHYRLNDINDRRAMLTRVSSPKEQEPFVTLSPHRPRLTVHDVRMIGVDAQNRLYFVMSEAWVGQPVTTYVYRFDAAGQKLAELEVHPMWERYLALPRAFRVTPQGDILTFRTTEKSYTIWRYRFP